MGSQLRRLRVKAGISGGNRGRLITAPSFEAQRAFEVKFIDELPSKLALLPAGEFNDGIESLRSELRTLLEKPEYRTRVAGLGADIAAQIDVLSRTTDKSREELTASVQHVLRVIAERGAR